MSRQKNSKCIWWKRFRAVLHHLHWGALPQCKQSQNSSQTLTDPQSSPGKKKATLDQSQPTDRETDVEMQCLNQDHTASSSRERIKVLHANPTPSLQLTDANKGKDKDSGNNWDRITARRKKRQENIWDGREEEAGERPESSEVGQTLTALRRWEKWDNGSFLWKGWA